MNFALFSGSLEQGLAYGILALGVFLTYRILHFPDLTVDGSFTLGGAVAASLIVVGVHPVLATLAAVAAGALAGLITGLLHTRLHISGLLAGILTATALYSVNLRIMGRANVPLLWEPTVFEIAKHAWDSPYINLVTFAILVLILKLLIDHFLCTEYGLALRATGDNPKMIRSMGVSTDNMVTVGLAVANAFSAVCGALVAQYQGFADASMGIGTIIVSLASVIVGSAMVPSRTIALGTTGVIVGSIVYRLAVFLALRAGFAPTDLKVVTAGLVVTALALPVLTAQRRSRKAASHFLGDEGDAIHAGS